MAHRTRKTKSKVDMANRVDAVLRLILAGCARYEIIKWAAEKTDWKVTDRTITAYIGKANRVLEAEVNKSRKAEFGKAARRFEDLYRRAMASEDGAQALAVLRERVKLFGLAEPEKIAVTGSVLVIER